MKGADLHLHTTASDGKSTPKELVQKAAELQLSAIAITDHDTTAGVAEADKVIKEHNNTELITGVEITCKFKDNDCHLLAYDFILDNKGLNKLLKEHQELRVNRASRILHQLSKKGIKIDLDEVLAEANGSPVGRPHIALVLQDHGIVASFREAFIRYLSDSKIEKVPVAYRRIPDVVQIVHQAGGATVLAHPGRLYGDEEMKQLIKEGVDGVEVVHPSHRPGIQKRINNFADEYQLLKTGGSDFHGYTDKQASPLGKVIVESKRVNDIKSYCQQYKKVVV